MSNRTVEISVKLFQALNRLYDAVSERVVENPEAPDELSAALLPYLEACMAAREGAVSDKSGLVALPDELADDLCTALEQMLVLREALQPEPTAVTRDVSGFGERALAEARKRLHKH